jgi:5-methylcytosine-specific restriction protein B
VATIEASPAESRLPHVLILDEMNRTDLSRMLGECFSLLEDRSEAVDLPGGGEDGSSIQLKIPDDLYVVGTMNLIDQSIEQIDFALRRRFLWVLCPFDRTALLGACRAKWETRTGGPGWEKVAADFERLADAAAKLNAAISDSDLLGAQYEVGHTYFMDVVSFLADTLGPRSRTYLWRGGEALPPVQQLWRLSLKPLLDQYLSGLEKPAREQELLRLQSAFLRSSQASG